MNLREAQKKALPGSDVLAVENGFAPTPDGLMTI